MLPAHLNFPLLLTALILAATLLPLIVIFGLVFWWLRRQKRITHNRWQAEGVLFLKGPEGANFSGLESKGMAQMRGNGFIALTGQDLRVTRAAPAGEWRIPHAQISQVELRRSFLGKQRSMPVLVVTFTPEGRQDRLGVYVADGTAWRDAIRRAAGLKD